VKAGWGAVPAGLVRMPGTRAAPGLRPGPLSSPCQELADDLRATSRSDLRRKRGHDFNAETGGVAGGLERRFDPALRAGIAFGYAFTGFSTGDGNVNTFAVTPYAR